MHAIVSPMKAATAWELQYSLKSGYLNSHGAAASVATAVSLCVIAGGGEATAGQDMCNTCIILTEFIIASLSGSALFEFADLHSVCQMQFKPVCLAA